MCLEMVYKEMKGNQGLNLLMLKLECFDLMISMST